MQNTSVLTHRTSPRGARPISRPLFFGPVVSAFLVAGAVLVGSGGGFRAAAAFPSAPTDEPPMVSMGVFRVVVDPNFYFLMDQGAFALPYSGWDAVNHTMTSPALLDQATLVAESAANPRLQSFIPPVQVGSDAANTISASPGYGAYLQWPDASLGWDFQYAPSGNREVLTEIRSFNLNTFSNCYPKTDPRAPSNIPDNITLVRAGYQNTYNGPSGSIPNYLRKSIGMVQSTSSSGLPADDFALPGANSFFDINVEITLPRVVGTPGQVFPLYGAVLTNADFDVGSGNFIPAPLVVESLALLGPSLPPSVVYLHTPASTSPFAVPLKFVYDNPGYWQGGDTFGTVVLAGHGTMDPCTKFTGVSNFLNAVLGPPGELVRPAIVGRLFTNSLFPSSSTVYNSAGGTNLQGGSIDAIQFTNGATLLRARSFSIGNLTNHIALPAVGASLIYTNTTAVVNFEISNNGTNFIPAQASGQVRVLIANTNSSTIYTTNYSTELLSLDLTGSSGFGSLKIKESPTKASLGKHIVQSAPGAAYRIGGDFSASLEYSFDNGANYKPANRPINIVQTVSVACGTPGPLNVVVSGSSVILSWSGSTFRLQGTTILIPATWVDISGASPRTLSTSGPYHFFRLICP